MRRVFGLLLGVLVPIATVHAAGPAPAASVPTFTKDVAPIEFNSCAT